MHVAAAYNHVKVLDFLLTLGISVNEPDSRLGYTPLHLAASVDNIEVLQCLHASTKADFTKRARNGFTILHVASAHGSERCVKFLIDSFPNLKYQNDTILSESPVHKAAKHSHQHVYKQLVESGARDDLENVQVRLLKWLCSRRLTGQQQFMRACLLRNQDDTAHDFATFNSRYYY